jgi:hypothetical protein
MLKQWVPLVEVSRFYEARPNPYKKGSYEYQAWKDGFSNAIWEEQMGYDL